ncbi:MAG: efflux RND transporter permease subunit [Lewinellaceae bacterium]|nr:efflux RND transporter permease subunit [Lewinellaceae bacterium]
MNLTKLSIDFNRVSTMVFLVILIMGVLSYNQLSRDSMPPYTIRVCSVVTQFPGASPERVEELITKKIEELAQELPELDNVTSESRTGLSIVQVTLAPDIRKENLQPVWDRLRRKIDGIKNQLPDGSRPPNVQDDGIGVVYGIMLGLEGDGYSNAELKSYAEDIRDELVKLEDASEVEIRGIQEEQIYVEFEDAQLAEIGLTASRLQNIIAATNIVFSGGQVSLEEERIVLEPTGNFESLEDLEKTLISLSNTGEALELGDITHIRRAYKSPADKLVRINGNPGLAISVALKSGANLIRLGEVVDERIAKYNQTLPIGIRVSRVAGQDYYVDTKISDFVDNVFQSVAIVLLVMLLFLGMRTGLVVASLIPMAMVMTLWLMQLAGVGLTQVSLAALIMALGLLVDNAIVVSESIMVKMEEGMPAKDAAIASARELTVPLLVSSLTTSAAFLAFYLAENTMGEMMGVLFVVISLALLSSWMLAMTMVPMLGVAFIRIKKKPEADESAEKPGLFDRLNAYYKNILLQTLHRPLVFLIVIIGTFFGSLLLFPKLPFIFFPDSDRNLVTLDLNLPLGTKIERTAEVVAQIEAYIKSELQVNDTRDRGIIDWSTFIGEGPASYDLGYQPGEANSGYAHLLLNTSGFEDNNRVIKALDDFCYQAFPNAEVTVGPLAGGGGGGADVAIRLSGEDPAELFRITERIKQKMNETPGVKNISDDWGPKIKKFVIDISQDNANRAGLTNQDIALSLQTTLDGFNSGSFREGDDNIPIVMRSGNSQDIDVREMDGINIFSQNSGASVPLVQVAKIHTQWQYAKILHRDLYRTVTISCDATEGYTASDLTRELRPGLEEESQGWKSGYTYEFGGESEQSSEAMGAVMAKLPLAGFIILLLLVLQFNSFRKTFIVLTTIPLGIIGVILGLLLFRSYFGFMAFLGVISLAGIVINNAIVLIDRIQIEIAENGLDPFDAIIAAAQQRFRPILLTTFTTTLGLIPLYLGGGLMWEPMAVSIMVGLLFATVITLLFVPVLYKLLFGVKG